MQIGVIPVTTRTILRVAKLVIAKKGRKSMTRFAPNLYHLFLELPVRERFAAAARLSVQRVARWPMRSDN
jgi:hypothetical protein